MFFRIVINFLGGFWKIKDSLNNTRSKFMKSFLLFIYSLYLQEQCSYIGYTSKFANKPTFPHGFFGVFISGDAIIGKNCVIFQNVTIGSNTLVDSKKIGSPKIGNNVYIGAGATITGDITIGNNCRIAANCSVS